MAHSMMPAIVVEGFANQHKILGTAAQGTPDVQEKDGMSCGEVNA